MAARILATRSRCPTVYWGNAPPQRVTRCATGRAAYPGRRREFGGGQRGEILIGPL